MTSSQLCEAIKSRNDSQVLHLLTRMDFHALNRTDGIGRSPLHYACLFSNHEAVSKLLDISGVNVNAADRYRKTPLHYACRQNNHQVVGKLANITGINVNAVDRRGLTPLHYACRKENGLAAVQLLRVFGIDVNIKDIDGMTPIMMAAKGKLKKLLELMVNDQRVDMEIKNNKGKGLEEILDKGSEVLPRIKDRKEECLKVVKEAKMLRRSREAKQEPESRSDRRCEDQNVDDVRASIRKQYIQKIEEVNKKIKDVKQTLNRKKQIKDKKMKELLKKQDIEKEVMKQKLFEDKTKLEEEMARLQQRIAEMEERGRRDTQEMDRSHLLNKLSLENQYADYESDKVLDDLMKRSNELTLDLKKLDMDPNNNSKLEEARGILECPVCLEMMTPPTRIWMCSESHSVCERCKDQLVGRKCPTCRSKMVTLRAFIVENFARALFKQ